MIYIVIIWKYIALHCIQTIIIKHSILGSMTQQTDTNSIISINGNHREASGSIMQIPFRWHYFASIQALVFLLCESCAWCACSASNRFFIKNSKFPLYDNDRFALILISRGWQVWIYLTIKIMRTIAILIQIRIQY